MSDVYSGACSNKNDVYFILDKQAGAVKIGVSSDVEARLSNLQAGNPNPLVLFAVWATGDYQTESVLHKTFDFCRIRGEWFEFDIIASILPLIMSYEENLVITDTWTGKEVFAGQTRQEFHHFLKQSRLISEINRQPNAVEMVLDHLNANPEHAELTGRKLAEIVGVGKDSAYKALAEWKAD